MEKQLDDFIIYCKIELSLSKNTIYSYKNDILDYIKYFNKGTKLTVQNIEKYCMHLNKMQYKTSSINRKLSSLVHFSKFLFQTKQLEENITINLPRIKQSRKIPNFLTKNEVETLIKTAHSLPNGLLHATIISLLYSCGGRISEIISLQKKSIEFDGKTLKPFVRLHGKGNKERIVPIDNKTTKLFQQYLLENMDKTCKYLFPSPQKCKKTYISRVYVGKMLKNIAISAGIDHNKVHPHAFRHSIALHLLNNQMDIRIIQEFLGHKDISTTSIYTHINQKEVVDLVENFHPFGKINSNL